MAYATEAQTYRVEEPESRTRWNHNESLLIFNFVVIFLEDVWDVNMT